MQCKDFSNFKFASGLIRQSRSPQKRFPCWITTWRRWFVSTIVDDWHQSNLMHRRHQATLCGSCIKKRACFVDPFWLWHLPFSLFFRSYLWILNMNASSFRGGENQVGWLSRNISSTSTLPRIRWYGHLTIQSFIGKFFGSFVCCFVVAASLAQIGRSVGQPAGLCAGQKNPWTPCLNGAQPTSSADSVCSGGSQVFFFLGWGWTFDKSWDN